MKFHSVALAARYIPGKGNVMVDHLNCQGLVAGVE